MANETPASDNSAEGVTQPSTHESRQPSSAISMYVDNKISILLQTCIALASNPTSVQPQEKHSVRIVLDSGSQKPYITLQIKETLDLKPIARERLCIKTFRSDYDNLKTVDDVNLCLKNVDNDVTVTITAYVVPIICSPLNYQAVQFAGKKHAQLKDIALSECIPEENLVVDILIEADQYWYIANGEVRRGESGPVAMNTRFGWTLSGPVQTAPRSDTHSVNLAATHILRVDSCREEMDVHEMELDEKLRAFGELESIGIKQEENSVLETFKETITFKNQRYEVGLPWKEAHDPPPENRSLSQRRLQSLLKRLSQKPEQLEEFDHVIKDQLDKGIIERVDQSQKAQSCHQIH